MVLSWPTIITLVVDDSSGYAKSSRLIKRMQVRSSTNYVSDAQKDVEPWFMNLVTVTSKCFDVTLLIMSVIFGFFLLLYDLMSLLSLKKLKMLLKRKLGFFHVNLSTPPCKHQSGRSSWSGHQFTKLLSHLGSLEK
jgi:hypothetical protein